MRHSTGLTLFLFALCFVVTGYSHSVVPVQIDAVRSKRLDPPELARLITTYFGTSTFSVTDGSATIIIDGFLSRPSRSDLLTPLQPDTERIINTLRDSGISKAHGVFVSHTHYDHALDAATIARLTGSQLYGSRSAARIAAAEGFPMERFTLLRHRKTFYHGDLKVTVLPWVHSPDAMFRGAITSDFAVPAWASAYREGGSYAFHISTRSRPGKARLAHRSNPPSILIVPTSNLVRRSLGGIKADIVFLSIGQLGKQSERFAEALWQEAVILRSARIVVPIHWDDFTKPLDEPLEPLPPPLDQFEKAMAMINEYALRDGVQVILPEAFMQFDTAGTNIFLDPEE
jgi:L-ascorbate metabolism protein UlaG (beta-lactamase superfamily)